MGPLCSGLCSTMPSFWASSLSLIAVFLEMTQTEMLGKVITGCYVITLHSTFGQTTEVSSSSSLLVLLRTLASSLAYCFNFLA